MLREVCLDTFHILFQGIGRSEVDDEFAVCQRRIGNASHQVVSSRSSADGSGDVGDFLTGLQVGFYLLQVLRYLLRVRSFGQLVLHVELVVHHIGEEPLLHEGIADAGEDEQSHHGEYASPSVLQSIVKDDAEGSVNLSGVFATG